MYLHTHSLQLSLKTLLDFEDNLYLFILCNGDLLIPSLNKTVFDTNYEITCVCYFLIYHQLADHYD